MAPAPPGVPRLLLLDVGFNRLTSLEGVEVGRRPSSPSAGADPDPALRRGPPAYQVLTLLAELRAPSNRLRGEAPLEATRSCAALHTLHLQRNELAELAALAPLGARPCWKQGPGRPPHAALVGLSPRLRAAAGRGSTLGGPSGRASGGAV